jgi:hypothetical protein
MVCVMFLVGKAALEQLFLNILVSLGQLLFIHCFILVMSEAGGVGL